MWPSPGPGSHSKSSEAQAPKYRKSEVHNKSQSLSAQDRHRRNYRDRKLFRAQKYKSARVTVSVHWPSSVGMGPSLAPRFQNLSSCLCVSKDTDMHKAYLNLAVYYVFCRVATNLNAQAFKSLKRLLLNFKNIISVHPRTSTGPDIWNCHHADSNNGGASGRLPNFSPLRH